jgi:hypothetical protein
MEGAEVRFPASIDGVALDGEAVRPPHDGYDDEGAWTGEDDDVRYPGPWADPVQVTWTPSDAGDPVTVALRYLGRGDEGSCATDADCEAGFACEDDACRAAEGSGGDVIGELVCTVPDGGEFSLDPSLLSPLDAFVDPSEVRGAVLAVGRIAQGTAEVPDALTWDGGRVVLSPVRWRVLDLLYTRLDLAGAEVAP